MTPARANVSFVMKKGGGRGRNQFKVYYVLVSFVTKNGIHTHTRLTRAHALARTHALTHTHTHTH